MRHRTCRGPSAAAVLSAVTGIVLLVAVSSVGLAAGLADQLVGTWRVVRYIDTDASGKVTYPFGEHPSGYFVYDLTGHHSVQIMRTPARPPFIAGDDKEGTDAEVRAAYDGYVAFFGTYRVDEAHRIVTHVVEGSLNPSYTGTDQPRPFTLEGDVLVIQVRDEDGSSYFRELHRVK